MSRPDVLPRVVVVNPLPRALRHYADAFVGNLSDGGLDCWLLEPDLELGDRGPMKRLRALLGALRILSAAALSRHPVIVIWPIMGWMDVVFWGVVRRPRARRLVVVHDPVPLRRQRGSGRFAGWCAARIAGVGAVETVTHTRLAADELIRLGIRVSHVLPHPVAPGVVAEDELRGDEPELRELLVAGQHKPARDLEVLEQLASCSEGWQLSLVGRGWPDLAGWRTDARFLDEEQLDARLRAATVVMLPYSYYFQSGIAVRCLELGVPVVGERHEFLESLYGAAWPGFVDGKRDGDRGEAWLAAAARAAGARGTVRVVDIRQQVSEAWEATLRPAQVVEGSGRGRAA